MAGIGRVSGAPYRGARHRLGHKDEFPAALVHAAIPLVLRDGQRATKRSLLYLVLDPLLRPGLLVLIPMITDTQNQSYYNTDRSGSIAPFNRPENRVGRLKNNNNNNNNNIRYIRRTMSWWSCYVRVSYRIASHPRDRIGVGKHTAGIIRSNTSVVGSQACRHAADEDRTPLQSGRRIQLFIHSFIHSARVFYRTVPRPTY